MKENLTPSQLQAVDRDGLDLCVTAGAGSGKTLVLVERFFRLVREKKARVDEILAITFTEKAAAEMKTRIAGAFEEAGMEEERREVEFAYISTIDSFCARILRENALEAGVDPGFSVLEEFDARRMMEEAADEVLLGGDRERLRSFLAWTDLESLPDTLLKLYDRIRHAGLPLSLETLAPPKTVERALDQVLIETEKLRETLRELKPHQREKVEPHLGIGERLRSISRSAAPSDLAAEVSRLADAINLAAVRNESVQAPLREIRETLLPRFQAERLEAHAAPWRELLGELLETFNTEYERAKNAAGVLDFADLEVKVRRLLRDAPEVRGRVRGRFLHVFLDEFQDTNPLQKEIVDLLRGENNFFAVGDAKQSIYGFRDADVGIITRYRREVKLRGGHVLLPENFRSRPEIVGFVNRIFPRLWGGTDVEFEPMAAAAEHDGKEPSSVEIRRARGARAEEARLVEAAALAGRLSEIVEGEEIRISRKDSPRRGEPLTYGDAAVLFRTTTHLRLYERALADRQVPYFVQKGRGYFQTQEVRDLMNLIRVLDNPRDDYPLAAALRSPLCGLSDDDLYRLARSRSTLGEGRLSAALESIPDDLTPEGRDRAGRFRHRLHHLRDRRGSGPLWIALEEVLSETDLTTRALLHANGRRRFANLRKLVDLVRAREAEGETSLPELVRALEEYGGTEIRESEAAVDSPRDDTVRLMTIHAAKGLEFPLVVLADLGHADHRATEGFEFRPSRGLGFPLFNPETGKRDLKPLSFEEIGRDRDEAERRESIRLLYVAATRAREHLILSGWSAESRERRDSWMKSILEGLEIGPGFPETGEVRHPGDPELLLAASSPEKKGRARRASLMDLEGAQIRRGEPLTLPLDDLTLAHAGRIVARVALPDPPVETTPYVATTTEILQHHLCPRRYHLRYGLGAPGAANFGGIPRREEGEAAPASGEAPPGGEGEFTELKDDEVPAEALGNVVHQILAEAPGSPRILALLATLENAGARREAERQVRTFKESRLGKEAAGAEMMKEHPFAFGRGGAILRGQIDLIVRHANGALWMVDYKTSRIGAGEVQARAADYELQLRIYALAVREVFGRLPAAAFLHFLHPDVIREVDLSPGPLEAAEEAIRAFFAAHRAGEYPQRPAPHCTSCSYFRDYCPNLRGRELRSVPE